MRAVIFANGRLNQGDDIVTALRPDDLLIAADGGAHHCLALGLPPKIVIGDLDSLAEDDLARLKGNRATILQYPRHKDFTDLELALRYALEQRVSEILILGALGDRWDQTIANLLLPAILLSMPQASPPEPHSGVRISIVDGEQEIFFLRSGEKLAIRGQPGDTVSLIPLAGNAHGVTTHNLEYPLDGADLHFGSTLGVSNVLLTESGSVSMSEGLMLCIVIHESSRGGRYPPEGVE